VDAPRDRGRRLITDFLLVNPRSGTSSPSAAELIAAARERGVEARVLTREDDAAVLVREAAERGARALGIAGGDGSLACAATVALERDLPLVVVPFGTENHFARDLGLDRDDPLAALDAFGGEERRVDAATVGGRVFLNNVSLGIYASMVHDPAHETRNRAAAGLRVLAALFGRSRRPLALSFEAEGRREQLSALVLLVASNDYGSDPRADVTRRERLDEGLLHAYVIEAVGRLKLAGLLARAVVGRAEEAEGWAAWASPSFRVDSRRPRVHAAIDGEAAVLEPPLEFEIKPRALRVLLPPSGDGVRAADASR
jgi:diacylglycerol kinase family enzyme